MMNVERLRKLLKLGHLQVVASLPSSDDVEAVGQAVCGLLNTTGGHLVCGTAAAGRSREAVALLERRLHEGLSPKSLVAVQLRELAEEPVIVIEVPAGKDVPYAFRDSIFLHTATGTHKAGVEIIRDLVMRRQIEPERWERRFSFAELESDLDREELWNAIVAAQRAMHAYFRNLNEALQVLEDFSVAKYGRLTNAGDVLFGRNPAARIPQIRVRAASYPTGRTGDAFSDFKTFEGPLVAILEQAQAFIIRNTPTRAGFHPGTFVREDRPLYPEKAVREALINAFMHRDYSSPGGSIAISLFPDRLEIWNSGGLPEGMTRELLLTGGTSILRNPDLAHVLYLRGLMERVGRGCGMIQAACRAHGLPAPKWAIEGNTAVKLTLFAPAAEVSPEATPEAAPEVTPEVPLGAALNTSVEVQRLIAQMEGRLLRRELQARLGLKDDEHFRKAYLLPALHAGLIEMTEPDKPRSSKQRYRLTPQGIALKARLKA